MMDFGEDESIMFSYSILEDETPWAYEPLGSHVLYVRLNGPLWCRCLLVEPVVDTDGGEVLVTIGELSCK